MKLSLNQIDLPFQVGQQVFVNQLLLFMTGNEFKTVPYFSGQIKSIEIIIDPKSRFIREEGQQHTLIIDMVRYEVQPHSQFNPFGMVQIFDLVEAGSKLFATEQGLLKVTGTESSVYHTRKGDLNMISTL